MGVSFMWEVVRPERGRCFHEGHSSDIAPLSETFGDTVSTKDVSTLRAMHRARGSEKSLWSEMADTLERLQGDDYDKEITLKVWTEF